ncbi:hypothetical protein GALL_489730 [mine drainage metagenome]|uniref:Uncharacterized protein n=1 Tax=mine drainage metagenome TaxID=410659 RepID=A0A1J5PVV4_9ZZZZ
MVAANRAVAAPTQATTSIVMGARVKTGARRQIM